jgi:general secretion pathway protein D
MFCINIFASSNEAEINVNFKKLPLDELVKITSKILNKNILISEKISSSLDFESNAKISKNDLILILETALLGEGFEIVKFDTFWSVQKIKKSKKILKNQQIKTQIFEIKNTNPLEILTFLNDYFLKLDYEDDDKIPIFSNYSDSNLLIFSGLDKHYEIAKGLISKLDIAKQQVYVQAKIIELSEHKTKDFGVKYNIQGINSNSSNALMFAGSFGTTVNVASNIAIPEITNGIILGASISLLQQNNALSVVSEPSLLCVNNKESEIYVGEARSVKTGKTTGSSSSETFERKDIGLKLKVKPRISSDNKVSLEINATLEDIKNEKGANDQPDTTKKEVKTFVIVNDGESVILGGLIKSKSEDIQQKVPFFGDIPLLGNLFKHSSNLNDKVNLVIVLTPYIIQNTENISLIRAKIAELSALEEKFATHVAKQLTSK